MKSIAAVVCFIFVLLVPLHAQDRPAWVNNPSAVYPDTLYVSAVGGGRDRQTAENGAKAALVSYFRQSVSSRITIIDSEQQSGGRAVRSASDMSMSIEAAAALDALIGVEIKAAWNDAKGKTGWWAVAVMEKAQGRERYTAELNKTVNEISRLINITGGVSFNTLAKCRTARELLSKAEIYALVLSMLDGPNRQDEIIRLTTKTDDTIKQAQSIPVDVRVTGDTGGRIKAAFAKTFTNNGFRTGSANSRFALIVKFNMEAAPKNQYYNTRYTLDAVLRDTQTGAELLAYNTSDRESHPASQA
ncbi:MAG: LPP20 family lipoprotein, partial [Spirochaetaceae bacterium]|nr:LPP20 family lipoprotein [Spirochaetaceae bacterium]